MAMNTRDSEWSEQKKWRSARERLNRGRRGRVLRRAEPPLDPNEQADSMFSEIAPGKL